MTNPFVEFFQSITGKNILITSHENADPDALCSAFAIEHLIHILYPDIKTIIWFDELNTAAEKILEKLNLELPLPPDFTCDGIILVDTNSADQLGELKSQINWEKPVLIIDHHILHPATEKIAKYQLINENAVATAEIIFEIYQSLNAVLSEKPANLILLGILADSRHLLLADNKTIRIIDQLLQFGVNYSESIEILTLTMDRSERLARLKAAQRVALHEFEGWIIAVSQVSSFEASACRALISLGADVALVSGKKKDEIRISARATNEIVHKTNLNLAKDVMEKIGVLINGQGGGHDRAAACNGKANLEDGITLALQLLKEKILSKS